MYRLSILLLTYLLPGVGTHAGPLAVPAAPQAEFRQQLNGQLPLSATFTDDNGRPVRLATLFDSRPAILVLGYYRCPNLCSTLMDGVLETLAGLGLPRGAYRVVGVSIDPTEDAPLAARKKASYGALVARAGGELHLLTGQAQPIEALARSAGLSYAYDPAAHQFAHPAGFLVATPEGRISHYFMGVRFDPRDVRLALIDASSGRIGSPVDRLLLLCSHYDPQTGRYSGAAFALTRIACLLVAGALAWWIWRHRMGQGRGP